MIFSYFLPTVIKIKQEGYAKSMNLITKLNVYIIIDHCNTHQSRPRVETRLPSALLSISETNQRKIVILWKKAEVDAFSHSNLTMLSLRLLLGQRQADAILVICINTLSQRPSLIPVQQSYKMEINKNVAFIDISATFTICLLTLVMSNDSRLKAFLNWPINFFMYTEQIFLNI